MKAIQIKKPNQLNIIETDRPVIDRLNNVLVKMTAAGICGSDIGIYHGTNAAATYPRIIGHEMIGIVEAAGADVSRIKTGDRVIVNQINNCGECYPCHHNHGNVCDHLQVRGVHIDGGYREYIAVPEKDCYVLPDTLSDENAIMIEPATIAIQACSRGELNEEDMLLIMGAGALGSTILQIAKLTCKHIIVADIVQEKLDEALQKGAHYVINLAADDFESKVKEYTHQRGATISIDAACTKDSLMLLLQATGNAGRVITMGFSTGPVAINQFLITSKELDVRGSRLQNNKFGEAIELIKAGKLDLNNSISHIFYYEEAQKAFDFIDSKDPSIRKVAFTFKK